MDGLTAQLKGALATQPRLQKVEHKQHIETLKVFEDMDSSTGLQHIEEGRLLFGITQGECVDSRGGIRILPEVIGLSVDAATLVARVCVAFYALDGSDGSDGIQVLFGATKEVDAVQVCMDEKIRPERFKSDAAAASEAVTTAKEAQVKTKRAFDASRTKLNRLEQETQQADTTARQLKKKRKQELKEECEAAAAEVVAAQAKAREKAAELEAMSDSDEVPSIED